MWVTAQPENMRAVCAFHLNLTANSRTSTSDKGPEFFLKTGNMLRVQNIMLFAEKNDKKIALQNLGEKNPI